MNKKRSWKRVICLPGVIGIFLTIWGCSPERDEYSFPPMIYDEQAYLREIKEADDLITLNVTRSNYAVALKKTKPVSNALREKWDLLSGRVEEKGNKIGKLCDEAELVAFDFEKIGTDRYRLYFLFRVIKEFQNNYSIYIAGRMDDPSLLPEPYREKGYLRWHFKPLPPTKFWETGKYVVVSQDITAPDLPFELGVNFDSPEGMYGDHIPIGIMQKFDQLLLDRETIINEENPFQLWKWLQYCHARSGPKGDLVRNRYREMINSMNPLAVVEDGIEYYGADLSLVAPGICRLLFLFRATGTIDRDYRILLYGLVSPENKNFLSDHRREAGKKSEKWSFPIFPRTSIWIAGEVIVVSHNIKIKPISYDLYAYLYDREEEKAGPRFEVGKLGTVEP